MKRSLCLIYGVACHLLFLGTFAYMAGFVCNQWVPKSIDSAPPGSVGAAVAINLSLMALFAAQHSIMARPEFKRVWTRIVPQPIERSTYVLASCLVTALLMWQWRTIDAIVWYAQSPSLRTAAWALFAAGWLLVPAVTLLINHFDLFGTRQVWLHWRRQDYTTLPFREPLAYKHVRHPLYLSWAIAFWATPVMTVGHLLFAGVLTVYMALAAVVEERDLASHFGRPYEEYRRRVPMFVPRLKPVAVSAFDRSEQGVPAAPLPNQEPCHA
jgi:protein-S-isoprenylcysteine O-methyltransferase Ste14